MNNSLVMRDHKSWYNALPYNKYKLYIDGSVQDCSNSIANALELLQSCSEPSIYLVDVVIGIDEF